MQAASLTYQAEADEETESDNYLAYLYSMYK